MQMSAFKYPTMFKLLLSARISFVGAKTGLTYAEQNRLHTFRLTSNRVLNHQLVPTRENLLRDVKTFIIKILISYNR